MISGRLRLRMTISLSKSSVFEVVSLAAWFRQQDAPVVPEVIGPDGGMPLWVSRRGLSGRAITAQRGSFRVLKRSFLAVEEVLECAIRVLAPNRVRLRRGGVLLITRVLMHFGPASTIYESLIFLTALKNQRKSNFRGGRGRIKGEPPWRLLRARRVILWPLADRCKALQTVKI